MVRSQVKGGVCACFCLTRRLRWTLMCFLPKAETLCVTGVVSERRTSPLRRKSDAGTHTHTRSRKDTRGLEPRKWSPAPRRLCACAGAWGEGRGRSFPHAQQGSGGGGGGGGRRRQLWRQPAFPACPGAAGLALTNLNEEPRRFRRHFRVMPHLIHLAGRKG